MWAAPKALVLTTMIDVLRTYKYLLLTHSLTHSWVVLHTRM